MKDELKFNPINHVYSLGNVKLTSVTNFVKKFFEEFDRNYWAAYVADRDGKRREEVLNEWVLKRKKGTNIHKLIENHLKGKQLDNYPNEVNEAINFLSDISKERAIPEMKVHSVEWMLAGTIDLVIETPDGVMLFDWKTTNKIRMDSDKKAKSPISHLFDCNYNQYILQLNLYKAIFEQQFNKKVIELGFVKLSRDGPFEYFPAGDCSKEIRNMLNHWLE